MEGCEDSRVGDFDSEYNSICIILFPGSFVIRCKLISSDGRWLGAVVDGNNILFQSSNIFIHLQHFAQQLPQKFDIFCPTLQKQTRPLNGSTRYDMSRKIQRKLDVMEL